MKFSVEKKYWSNPFTYYKMPKKIKDDGKKASRRNLRKTNMTVQQRMFFTLLDKHKRLYGKSVQVAYVHRNAYK